MRYPISSSTVALVALAAATLPAPAFAQARNPVFTADQEACFGRVYDRAHLASHPQQKVTSFYLLRSLSARPDAENWQPDQRGDAIKRFREDGRTDVFAFVTFRDRKGNFYNSLTCDKAGKDGGILCFIDCDGGSFVLKRDSTNSILLNNSGFYLIGGCSEEIEPSKQVFFSPGKDDKVFRLDSKPVDVCRAEEQKVVPIRTGKPLRERFTEDEAFCFGSDYDAAHLVSHPQQMVASLRVGRLDPAKEKTEEQADKWWWNNVQLDVSMKLKAGAAPATHYVCIPQEGSWECLRQVEGETPSACRDRAIQLVRGPGDDILVYNRNSGLPIDKECESAPTGQQYPQNPPTRTDDKTFRLSRMPVQACRP